jgi:DNA-binding IclR family transcriptional regulator
MQSADRTLAILGSFGSDRPSLRVSELATELGIHKSTVSRLLATLERRRFVCREGGRFVPGPEVIRIARLVSGEGSLVAAAAPAVERLARDTGETTVIGVRRGDDAFFVYQAQGEHILGVAEDWAGRSTPLHVSAIGKAIMAFDGRPYDGPLPGYTPRTITDPAAFARELRRVRARGYAVLRDELEEGLSAVGVPVFDEVGSCVAGVSVTGPTFRIVRSTPRLAERCRAAAAEITSSLGARDTARAQQRGNGAVQG